MQHRQPVDEWLKDKRLGIVFGDPGFGKSTLLRFLALDILSERPRFGSLGALHKNRLPVWIPFGFWTALIADNSAAPPSIEDVAERWLRNLACDHLWPAFEAAMTDERLLLLVDGLDEHRSESAAGIALRQLQVFVELRKCSAIVTSRPVGFQKLPAMNGEWMIGSLAEFSQIQQHDFATEWIRFRLYGSKGGSDEVALLQRASAEVERFEAEVARNAGLQELAQIPLLLGILVYLNSSSLPLPRTRFQAYRHMVDHLIAEHPRARERAASVIAATSTFTAEDQRSILAALAYGISTSHPEGAIERYEALKIVRAFLSHTELGFGYEANAARQAAERIIREGDANLGLLVERAPGLYSFVIVRSRNTYRRLTSHRCLLMISSGT